MKVKTLLEERLRSPSRTLLSPHAACQGILQGQPHCRRRQWHPTPVLLPRKSYGRRSLIGCSPWGREESDTTERLHFHFSLSCTGEGNGNPLQCSCLENPGDRGVWWAAVSGVAQSRTQLKRLSSSSSKVVLKILQARLQKYVNSELPNVQDGFKKGEEQEIILPTSIGP